MGEPEARFDRLIRGLRRNLRIVIVAPILALLGLVTLLDGLGESPSDVVKGAAALTGSFVLVFLAYIGGKADR